MTAQEIRQEVHENAPYTIQEFRKLIHNKKSVRRLQEMCEEELIPAIKLGGTWLIAAKWANDYVKKLCS